MTDNLPAISCTCGNTWSAYNSCFGHDDEPVSGLPLTPLEIDCLARLTDIDRCRWLGGEDCDGQGRGLADVAGLMNVFDFDDLRWFNHNDSGDSNV